MMWSCCRVSDHRRVAKLGKYMIPGVIADTIRQLNFEWLERLCMEKPWVCYDSNQTERYVFGVTLRGEGVLSILRNR